MSSGKRPLLFFPGKTCAFMAIDTSLFPTGVHFVASNVGVSGDQSRSTLGSQFMPCVVTSKTTK